MVAMASKHLSLFRWGAAPQWLSHQVAWWICILGTGWIRPGAMVAFIGAHLWFTRPMWRRELRVIGWSVALGFTADSGLAWSGAVAFDGGLRVGLVPLWMISLWAGFGATLLHSQRRMLKGRWLAVAIGAVGGPLGYLGGERLGCLTVGDGFGLVAIGLAWALVFWGLEAILESVERDTQREGVSPARTY
jgi:hypothetical protein